MDVFISYAHEDAELVGRLHAALRAQGREAWIDTEGIEPADRWRGSAQEAIERADAFVFVLSRASLGSRACLEELDYAVSLNKRLIAICVDEAVADAPKPAALDELSWIMMRPQDEFERGVERLVHALDTDLEVVRAHTRILVRARAWDLANRRPSPLLRGDELAAAEEWLSRAALGGGPQPTELQREFVLASRRAATRRQRTIAGISMLVALIAVGLSILALIQRNDAVNNQKTAQSRLLAAEAEANLSSDASLSTLLALRALRIRDTTQAEQALRDALTNLQALVTFRAHRGPVTGAAFNPAGSRIVTGSTDGTARIWDVRTGAQLLVLRAPVMEVGNVAFSPDGSTVATANLDGTARTFDSRTGAQRLVLRGGVDPINDVTYSRDSSRIATVEDAEVAVWDARTGRRLRMIQAPCQLSTVSFNQGGSRIVATCNDGTARVWDAQTGTQVSALRAGAGPLDFMDAEFSWDGSKIVTAGDHTRVWDARTGRMLRELTEPTQPLAAPTEMTAAFSRDGSRIVTANGNQAEVWDAQTGRQLTVLGTSTGGIQNAGFSPDGSRIVTGSLDATARVWNAQAGNQLLIVGDPEGAVRMADYSPDGSKLVTANLEGTARIWDVATGRQLRSLRDPAVSQLGSAAFSPDGSEIVTANDYNGTADLWDARTGRTLATLTAGYSLLDYAAFSPDGSRILTVGSGVTLWDARTAKPVLNVVPAVLTNGHEVIRAGFTPDGRRIVTADGDGAARVYDARSGRNVLVLIGNGGLVNSAVFSPDGSRILTASDSGTRVWDAHDGKQLLVLEGHAGPVRDAAFSRDGSLIATGGDDQTVRIWNAHTGAQLLVFHGDTDHVTGVEFAPHGSGLVSASSDQTGRIWTTALAAPVRSLERLARSLVTRPFTPQERAEYLAGIGG